MLPKGVRLSNGYLQVRIMHKGMEHIKHFGPDSPEFRDEAEKYYIEKKLEIRRGTFGIKPKVEPIKFKKARDIFHHRHYVEYRDESTNKPRTKGSIDNALSRLNTIGEFFDNYYLHEITPKLVKTYKEKRVNKDNLANATWNKERMFLYSLFQEMKTWVTNEDIKPVRLPDVNPVESVSTLVGNERGRVPDTFELADAYKWCMNNDPEFWNQGIEYALMTALRKADLIGLDNKLTVKGIQKKTGEAFDLPLTLEKPVNMQNYRGRWDKLRVAMGWKSGEKHTTWHDLRHWAPTILAEAGQPGKIIQAYLGHSSEKMSERYTNIRQKALEPAVDIVKKALEDLKK